DAISKRGENNPAVRRPRKSVITVEVANTESQLPRLPHVAIRQQPQMRNNFLLSRDQILPVMREADPEIIFEVIGQATNLAARICEHPQLRRTFVRRPRREYQILAVRRPQSLCDGSPARSPQLSFFSGRTVDSQEAPLFRSAGDNELRTVRRPGGSD